MPIGESNAVCNCVFKTSENLENCVVAGLRSVGIACNARVVRQKLEQLDLDGTLHAYVLPDQVHEYVSGLETNHSATANVCMLLARFMPHVEDDECRALIAVLDQRVGSLLRSKGASGVAASAAPGW